MSGESSSWTTAGPSNALTAPRLVTLGQAFDSMLCGGPTWVEASPTLALSGVVGRHGLRTNARTLSWPENANCATGPQLAVGVGRQSPDGPLVVWIMRRKGRRNAPFFPAAVLNIMGVLGTSADNAGYSGVEGRATGSGNGRRVRGGTHRRSRTGSSERQVTCTVKRA